MKSKQIENRVWLDACVFFNGEMGSVTDFDGENKFLITFFDKKQTHLWTQKWINKNLLVWSKI